MNDKLSQLMRAALLLLMSAFGCGGSDGPVTQAASSPLPGPRVFFADVEAGPVNGGPNGLGLPIAIFGNGFGANRGSSQVTIGGVEVASYLLWGANNAHNRTLDMIVVQPGGKVSGGPIVVTVNGRISNADVVFKARRGSIYYVAPTGSDRSDCSEKSPCASILHTLEAMKPGDAALVRGGAYAEGEIWIRNPQGGAPGASKVIRNYPGEEVYLTNPARDLIIDASHITVSGLNFQNGKAANVAGWASPDERGNRFINNTFSGNINYAAIELTGPDHVIAGNVCSVSGSSQGTQGHCYYVTQGSNLKILYNIGSGAPGYGLHLYDERRRSNDMQRIIRNVLVEGNIFKQSTRRAGMIVGVMDEGSLGNRVENVIIRNNVFARNNYVGIAVIGVSRALKIYNNTFYENGRQAINIGNYATIDGIDIQNNLMYDSTSNGSCTVECQVFVFAHVQVGAAAKNVTIRSNSYHPGSPVLLGPPDTAPITGAVEFADPAALDFHIRRSAIADRARTLADVPTDFEGRKRPQGAGYDTGAFEYVIRDVASLAH